MIFNEHVAAEAMSRQALEELVRAHLRAVRAAHERDAFVDVELAVRVGEACLALLESYDGATEDHRRGIQAACTYFAAPHDGEDDFESVVGFDDDRAILNHVAVNLGRYDLLIRL